MRMRSPAQASCLRRCANSAPACQGQWMVFGVFSGDAHAQLLLQTPHHFALPLDCAEGMIDPSRVAPPWKHLQPLFVPPAHSLPQLILVTAGA